MAAERRRLGLTQEAFAELLGIAQSALQNYEQDRNTIKAPVMERMRKAKVDVDYVVYGRDPEALKPLDTELWERVKAWDSANSKDADGNLLNEYARYQRVTLLYRWLVEGRCMPEEFDERIALILRTRAA